MSVALCVFLAVAVTALAVRAEDHPDTKNLQAHVDRLFDGAELPGLSVAVAVGNGEIETAVAGHADLEQRLPVTCDTGFFIGSISKNLFATILLAFADRGDLALDDPLSKFVAWPGGEDIQVRMLLNHTSGIPEYLDETWFTAGADGGIPEPFRVPRGPRELIATLADSVPAFPPGSRQEYSNTNALLVGEVIRHVAGQPLAAVFERTLVEPLALQRMYLYGSSTESRTGTRARGYSGADYWGAAAGELVDCSRADEALLDVADGSVVASARELLQVHRALRNGELLAADSWSEMNRVEPGTNNGLAYMIIDGPYGPVRGNLGRSMGHVAASLYYVDQDTYVVMMTNRSDRPLPLKPLLDVLFGGEE